MGEALFKVSGLAPKSAIEDKEIETKRSKTNWPSLHRKGQFKNENQHFILA